MSIGMFDSRFISMLHHRVPKALAEVEKVIRVRQKSTRYCLVDFNKVYLIFGQGTVVLWIKCSILETEVVSCSPRHGSVDVFFLLLLHFLYNGSFQSVVCPVLSFFEVQHYRGINFQPWKKALDSNLSL